ncbi:hypothetical protein CDAR_604571 [Caerostris darwini]|uniref:Uncharacterized protein n=1 Tax=Caerostris darwini TaxID=1538125 RepID=A0AAV4MS47_9ARAC|nr:hypothetical protein CDAR_604571 [Caerostris darwini]
MLPFSTFADGLVAIIFRTASQSNGKSSAVLRIQESSISLGVLPFYNPQTIVDKLFAKGVEKKESFPTCSWRWAKQEKFNIAVEESC